MVATTAYDEIIDFIASGTSPETVIAFRPSQHLQMRVSELLFKNSSDIISNAEKSELDNYMLLEHLMRMAKGRAYQILAQR